MMEACLNEIGYKEINDYFNDKSLNSLSVFVDIKINPPPKKQLPEDLFTDDELSLWAKNNGYVK